MIAALPGLCDHRPVMSARPLLFVLLVTAAGCGDGCGCGQAVNGGEQGAPPAEDPAGGTLPARTGSSFSPLADSPERTQLEAYAKALLQGAGSADGGVLRAAGDFTAAAPDALAGFGAPEPAKPVTKTVGTASVPSVQRTYQAGERSLRLRVTDTLAMPTMREKFAQRLTTLGNDASGNQRGRVVGEHVVMHAYQADRKRSRASMFVDGRFLIEADVRGTSEADDAIRVLEAVPLGALRGDSGSVPAPQPQPDGQ